MALKNEGLFRTYIAGAAVNGKRFVKFDSDDRTVIQGAAASTSSSTESRRSSMAATSPAGRC